MRFHLISSLTCLVNREAELTPWELKGRGKEGWRERWAKRLCEKERVSALESESQRERERERERESARAHRLATKMPDYQCLLVAIWAVVLGIC